MTPSSKSGSPESPPAGPSRVLEVAGTWSGEPVPPREAVRVRLRRAGEDGGLGVEVQAPFHGDPPPPGPPGPRDGLWRHEVVELFLAAAPRPPYLELELSPHGHFLLLRLEGVRRRRPGDPPAGLALDYQAEIRLEAGSRARWQGRARLPRELLPAAPERLWGNAFAIHGQGAARRYLAWRPVPGATPDFHRPERFAPLGWQ